MENLIVQYGIFVVAGLVMINEMGVPTGVPIEVVLLLAGALAIHSVSSFFLALLLLAAADVTGTVVIHIVARTGGSRLLGRVLTKFGRRSEASVEHWRARLGGHDRRVVLVGRMLPLVRMYISIGAGLLRFRFRDFILGAIPGAIIWSGIPLGLGFFFRDEVGHFATEYQSVTHYLFVIMPVFSILALAAWWVHQGGTAWNQLRRGRSTLGFFLTFATIGFIVRALWLHPELLQDSFDVIAKSLLTPWMVLLAACAVALAMLAFGDLHLSFRKRESPIVSGAPVAAAELATTLIWGSLVIATVAIMIAMQIRFFIL